MTCVGSAAQESDLIYPDSIRHDISRTHRPRRIDSVKSAPTTRFAIPQYSLYETRGTVPYCDLTTRTDRSHRYATKAKEPRSQLESWVTAECRGVPCNGGLT